jgi:hypothetical protein
MRTRESVLASMVQPSRRATSSTTSLSMPVQWPSAVL